MITGILHIKNMVCGRCIKTVAKILCDMEIEHRPIVLGEVHLLKPIDTIQKEELEYKLSNEGFDLIDDNESRIILKIKKLIIELIQKEYLENKITLSSYLSENLYCHYSYLSNLFSSIECKTIENYFILQKIDRIKELLVYDELSISEVAYKLGYSSVAHLSNQFKEVTGLTPSFFKSIGANKRKPVDTL